MLKIINLYLKMYRLIGLLKKPCISIPKICFMYFSAAVFAIFVLSGKSQAFELNLNKTCEDQESCLIHLLSIDPRIKSARKVLEASLFDVEQAKAAFLPTLNITSDLGREYIDNPSTRTAGSDYSMLFKRNIVGLANINIYSGGRDTAILDNSYNTHQMSQLNYQAVESAVILEGLTVFLNLIKSRHLLGLSKKGEEIVKEQLELEDYRVEQGQSLAVDVLQAKARLQMARQRTVQLKGKVVEAYDRFVNTFGLLPPDNSANENYAIDLPIVDFNLNGLIDIGNTNNIGIQLAKKSIQAADQQRAISESTFYPNLNFEVRGSYERDAGATVGWRTDFSLMLKASWLIFDGFSTSNAVASANKQLSARLDDNREAHRRLKIDLNSMISQYVTTVETLKILENAYNISQEMDRARIKMEEAGKETLINALDAKSQVIDAQIALDGMRFDLNLIKIQIYQMIGMLSREELNLG